MNDFDTRGRSIAHSFWSEMEKIAISHQLRLRAANAAGKRVDDYVKATGIGFLQRTTGLGQKGKAYKALKARETNFRKSGLKKLEDRKSILNQHISGGGPNQTRAVQELKDLNKVKRKTPGTWSDKPNANTRTTGGGTDLKPVEKPMSTLHQVALGTGVGLTAAGAAVGGKKLYDWDKQKKQGFQQGY